MIIQVNGKQEKHKDAVCAFDLLKERCRDSSKGVAIAKNGSILNRSKWSEPLSPGDQIEIIIASQGG